MRHILFAYALLSATNLPATAFAETPLDLVILTPTRFEAATNTSSVDITVITADDIKKSAAKTLPALLAQRAGVQLRSNDGTQDMAIDMRGFGMSGNQNTLVLLDGQPLNDIELTSIRWSAIPLASIERIEIINGSGAVLYGGGATGGTINIVTRHPEKEMRGSVGMGSGSYGAKEWKLDFSGPGKRAGMRIAASGLDSSNYRDNNTIAQKNLEADLRTDAGQGEVFIKFGADTQSLRYPGVRTVDPSVGLNELENEPRGTSTPLDYGKREGRHVSMGTTQQLDFGQVAGEFSYRDKNQRAYFDYGGGFSDYLDTSLKLLSITPRVKMPYQLGGSANELIVGVDIADWDYDSRRASNPDGINTPTAHILATQSNRALYVQNATQLDADTRLTLGARTQQVDYQARDVVNTAAYASADQLRSVNVFELGLRHSLNHGLSLFGRIGRSFRVATVDEIFDQFGGPFFDSQVNFLELQTSRDSELGIDYNVESSKVRAVIFQMNLNNEIHYNALTFTNMNLSPTRRYGLELEGSHNYSDTFEMAATYSYTVAKFSEGSFGGVDVSGNNIPLVPRQRITLSSSWKVFESTTLGGNANHVGKQCFDNDQANSFGQQMPAYTTVDMTLSHRKGAWMMTAIVSNLFNQRYFTYGIASTDPAKPGRYSAYPMQERSLSINAVYEL